MKTSLTYGFLMALGGAIVNLLLFFAGFHDNADKMAVGQWLGIACGVAITVTCLALAMRERRSATAPEANWSYGSAFGIGVATAAFGLLIGAAFSYVYFAFINPNMSDVIYQMQVAKMEAKNIPAERIQAAAPMIRRWMTPPILAIFGSVYVFVCNVVLALIVAIFFRRRPTVAPLSPPPMAG